MNAWPNSWHSLAKSNAAPNASAPPRLNRCGNVAMKRCQSRDTRKMPTPRVSGKP
ncbi:hypothetical protein D3C80_1867170 [compost metagenome]